jgi:hypothetical protein
MARYWVSVDAIALSAATAKSIFELATPSTDRALIDEWAIEFDGVTAANTPVKVELGRFSAAVTTATSITPEKFDVADGASAVTCKHTTSTEGAGTADDIKFHRIPPTSGLGWQYPLGKELVVPVSAFFRFRLTAAQTVNVTFYCAWSE